MATTVGNAAASNLEHAKVLGVHWNTKTDSYSLPAIKALPENTKWTKRSVLGHLNGFYDPLGLKSPATLPLKIFFQQLWKLGIGWDTLLNTEKTDKWKSLLALFHTPSLSSSIPRLAIPLSIEGCSLELHLFVDASQHAYSAVSYLVCRQPDGYGSSSLLASKARVAPINSNVTIPRMELLANLLGAILGNHIIKELTSFQFTEITLWTDSMISLCWIRNESKKELPVFVRNRSTKINSLLPTAKFKHIDGSNNPGDVASRGCTSDELLNHPLWFKGPHFLSQPPNTWSPQPELKPTNLKETTLAINSISTDPIHEAIPPIVDANRFNSWTKLTNTLIVILIFVQRLKKIQATISRVSLHRRAEQLLFKMSQTEYPPSPHLIKQLRMYQCPTTSLWRCRGRIENSEIPNEAKYPIYLPRESSITRLYILHIHQSINHFGQQHTLTELRQRVWIPKGIATIKSTLRHCMPCKRARAKPFALPEYPDLPSIRTVRPDHPFSAIGMDLAGPMYYRSDNGSRAKCWILVLTCLHIRATYLDLITDMSVKTLLSRIRRFVATYGSPATILCDNASSFIALNKLQEAFRPSEKNEISDYCAQSGIHFKFIVPFSPWAGGIYERIVGLTKTALKSAVGNKNLPIEEFITILKEIEAILNSRPLTSIGSDINFLPLRPMDFLRPHASLSLPRLKNEGIEDDNDSEWRPVQNLRDSVVDSWTQSMALLNRFWKRWQREYLTSLRERFKRDHDQGRLVNHDSPQYGDIVIIADPALERGQWKLGKIIELKSERSAVVKTATGTLHRPLSLLYKLEIESTKESNNQINELNPPINANQHSNAIKEDDPNPINPRPLRRSARLNPTVTLIATIALLSTLGAASDARCPQATSAQLNILYVTPCTEHGFGVATIRDTNSNTQSVCWQRMQCPNGHLRMPNPTETNSNYCGPKCKCPEWTRTCSFYNGKHASSSTIDLLPSELRNYVPPHVCSFKLEEHCDSKALFGLFSKIELMDGTTLIVPELDISTTDVFSPDDHRCYDMTGKELPDFTLSSHFPVTGSSSFCRVHTCTDPDKASAFCYFGEKVSSIVFLDKTIPIRAWGTVRQLYYPHAIQTNATQSKSRISMQCSHLGIEVQALQEPNTISIRACIGFYCIFIQELHPSENPILFPWSLVSDDHEINIQSWIEGLPQHDEKIQCKGRPVCERIRCKMCISFALSPSCWNYFDSFIFFISIFIVGYIISRILDLCRIFSYSCKLLSCFYRGFRRICCFFFRRNQSNPNPIQPMNYEFYRPRSRKKLLTTIVAIMTILGTIRNVQSCSEVSSINTEENQCTRSEDGILHCSVSNSVVLTLRPIGQSSCLVVRDSSGKIGTILTVQVNRISHRCDKQSMFFTRSHEFTTRSHHVCGDITNSGACDGITCNSINHSAPLPFFESTTPGYNFCSSSCGCVTCGGCISCSPSCVFYRIGVTPTTKTTYEAFRCLQWTNHVEVFLSTESNNERENHQVDLAPGQTHRWNDITTTLLSTSLSHTPILSSHFLSDGSRTCLIEDAAPSLFTPGSAGQLQCGSRDDANYFRCQFLPTTCTCSTSSTSASCSCPDGDMERFFKKEHRTLPLQREGLQLVSTENGIEAYTTDNQVMQIKINLDNLLLDTMVDFNKCDITASSAVGCYNCIAGASIDINCVSSTSDTSTTLVCTDNKNSTIINTIVKCNKVGSRQTIVFSPTIESIQLNCFYSCPGEQSQAKTIQIEGQFEYVDEVEKNPSNQAVNFRSSEKKTAKGIDIPDLSLLSLFPSILPISIIISIIVVLFIFFLLYPRVCSYIRKVPTYIPIPKLPKLPHLRQ